MTPAARRLIEMFTSMKQQNQDQLDRVERIPGFRMVQMSQSRQVDVTEECKQRLRDSIDEWQRAIDYLVQQNP